MPHEALESLDDVRKVYVDTKRRGLYMIDTKNFKI